MNREYPFRYRYHPPSVFFPIALITAGVVWLLVNNGTIPVENIYRLAPLWPALLILVGLSILFRRIWWPLNALMWLAVAALVVWLLTTGSAFLPKLSPVNLKHETLRQAVGQAKSASIKLDLAINPTTVHALTGTNDLLVADVYSINGMLLDASGNEQMNVELRSNPNVDNFFFNPRIDQWFEVATHPWDIGISPVVPLQLTINAGTARTDLNLGGLKLTSLQVDAGTGQMSITLPESQASLPVQLNMGTGGMEVNLPASTPVDLTADGGTGGLQIRLPPGAGVQVYVPDSGLGGLNLPSSLTKVSGNAGDKEGTYQNAAFNNTDTPVKITLHMGTGGVTIH